MEPRTANRLNGGRQMANGERRTADGGRQTADGRRQTANEHEHEDDCSEPQTLCASVVNPRSAILLPEGIALR